MGMALAGFTKGKLNMPGDHRRTQRARALSIEEVLFAPCSTPTAEIEAIREECADASGESLHDALMDRMRLARHRIRRSQLLVSHQDALLMGGKVQAAPGYADHVVFADPGRVPPAARSRICVEMCSGQAIATNPEGRRPPVRQGESACTAARASGTAPSRTPPSPAGTNVEFKVGAGGLHSVEN